MELGGALYILPHYMIIGGHQFYPVERIAKILVADPEVFVFIECKKQAFVSFQQVEISGGLTQFQAVYFCAGVRSYTSDDCPFSFKRFLQVKAALLFNCITRPNNGYDIGGGLKSDRVPVKGKTPFQLSAIGRGR